MAFVMTAMEKRTKGVHSHRNGEKKDVGHRHADIHATVFGRNDSIDKYGGAKIDKKRGELVCDQGTDGGVSVLSAGATVPHGLHRGPDHAAVDASDHNDQFD
jgi:hypothetical protein